MWIRDSLRPVQADLRRVPVDFAIEHERSAAFSVFPVYRKTAQPASLSGCADCAVQHIISKPRHAAGGEAGQLLQTRRGVREEFFIARAEDVPPARAVRLHGAVAPAAATAEREKAAASAFCVDSSGLLDEAERFPPRADRLEAVRAEIAEPVRVCLLYTSRCV